MCHARSWFMAISVWCHDNRRGGPFGVSGNVAALHRAIFSVVCRANAHAPVHLNVFSVKRMSSNAFDESTTSDEAQVGSVDGLFCRISAVATRRRDRATTRRREGYTTRLRPGDHRATTRLRAGARLPFRWWLDLSTRPTDFQEDRHHVQGINIPANVGSVDEKWRPRAGRWTLIRGLRPDFSLLGSRRAEEVLVWRVARNS